MTDEPGHIATWFVPERPVAGTVYIRSDSEVGTDAPGDRSAALPSS